MSKRDEENFRKTIKTLVETEPDKLAFFDGALCADGDVPGIPPFVPFDTVSETATPDEDKDRKNTDGFSRIRRRYGYGMAAAAACFVVFMSAALLQTESGIPLNLVQQDNAVQESAPASVAEEDQEDAPALATGEAAEDAPALAAGEAADAGGPVYSMTEPAAAPVSGDDAASPVSPEVSTEAEDIAQSPGAEYDGEDNTLSVILSIGAIICIALFILFFVKRKNLR